MDVKLPKLGEGAESGVVVSILVKEGDQITKGQTIVELENEKAVAPIPSTASGVVSKLRVKEGDKLSVGQTILTVTEQGGATPAAKPAERKAERATRPEPEEEPEVEASDEGPADEGEEEPAQSGLAPAAAPSVRRVARELGIDLRRVRGTERGGRIAMADVRDYIARLQKLAAQAKAAKPAATPPKAAAPKAESVDFSKWGPVTKKPMLPLRQTISRRLAENWNTIPHVTQFDQADITTLNELRKKFAPTYEKKGARLTLTSFALKAVATALKAHPIFNSSLDLGAAEIVLKNYYHIGVAVDTEQGLIVPVIRDVDKKNLLQLSREINEAAEKARDRKVTAEELKGGTFTVSNQGGIGGGHFTPIVNAPEVAILGLGRGAMKAVVREGKIEARLMMPMGLSYDHRVIDGGSAARFIVDLVAAFEGFKEEDVKL